MQIPISDTYRIESDARSFTLQKRLIYTDQKTGEPVEKWDNVSYHADLPQAIESYFRHRCRTSEAKGLQAAADEIKAIYGEVAELVKSLEFKVVVSHA